MTVASVSPQLRLLSTSYSSITTRLRRFVLYVWIVVITLHNISIVSNSALNPSLIITTATTTSITNNNNIHHYTHNKYNFNQKIMFRTVLTSNTRGASMRTSSGTALELLPLKSAALTTESSSFLQESSTIQTKGSSDENDAATTSPSKSQKLKKRSPLKTRFGLFRRKLMIDDNSDDDDNDISSLLSEYKNTTVSTPPSSGPAMLTATTTGGITYLNKNPWTIGSLFRGGATTTIPTTTTTSTSTVGGRGYYGSSIYGVYMILSKLFHTIFVQNFCYFANFVGTTKTRCFCLLVFSVFIESYATTLSKQAKDTGNALLFARACLVYLFWYDFLLYIISSCYPGYIDYLSL